MIILSRRPSTMLEPDISPIPAKRPKLLSDGFHYGDSDPHDIPFSIRWGDHPETQSPENPEEVEEVTELRTGVIYHPTPTYQHSALAADLDSLPDVSLPAMERVLGHIPHPFPDLPIDKVMEILNHCKAPSPIPPPNPTTLPPPPEPFQLPYHGPPFPTYLHRAVLSVEGPIGDDWHLRGFLPFTSYADIEEAVWTFLHRSRRDSDINTRMTLVFMDETRNAIGDNFKSRLWDITPTKLASEIYKQFCGFREMKFHQLDKIHLKITVSHQESSVKTLSDDDVKKKRSIITIYEKPESSLIHAVYVGVQRNRIISEKKATAVAKKKKELENRLTNEYRKGRKSLRKKTQQLLDQHKVVKSIDESWGFEDIPMLEAKLGVRCVVFSSEGRCLYEGSYRYQDNEIDLLFICKRFHVLASRNVFRNYCAPTTVQTTSVPSK